MKKSAFKERPDKIAATLVLSAGLLSVEQVRVIRNKLPDNWKWHKCYELPYINFRTGHEFVMKHWALTDIENKGAVHSLGLISHDHHSTRKEFMDDIPVQFVEKSLLIIDSLLAEIERLQACR